MTLETTCHSDSVQAFSIRAKRHSHIYFKRRSSVHDWKILHLKEAKRFRNFTCVTVALLFLPGNAWENSLFHVASTVLVNSLT